MNILIIHEIDWINKVVFEPHHFAELFSKKGHNVFVIDCPDIKNKKRFSGLKTNIDYNYSRIYDDASITLIHPPSILIKGLNRISNFLTVKKIIKKVIIENKIDIILLYGAITNGIQTIELSQELNIPVVYRLLDISHGLVKIPIIKNLSKKFERNVLSNSNIVLATTPDLSRYAIEMGAKSKNVDYFNLGINTKQFKPLKKNLSLVTSFEITDNDNIVVFIGTIYPFSGLYELIEDFVKIYEKNKSLKFIIVGGGPGFNKLKKLVISKKLESRILLTNFKPQEDLPHYICLADICINPFQINYVTNKILPTKILEYFACGKPVLSTPLEGTLEVLPNEEFGIVYSDSEFFIKKLSDLLENKIKLKELGMKAYDYAQKNHDWDILTEQLISKFESLRSK